MTFDEKPLFLDDCPCRCVIELTIDNVTVSLRHHANWERDCNNFNSRLYIEHHGKPFEVAEKVVEAWNSLHSFEAIQKRFKGSFKFKDHIDRI